MQRRSGVCRAKGGSMHLTWAQGGMLGSYAIVGAHLPMATGAAWSARLRGTAQVAVAFFGDGATNIGAFHEALNLAAVWQLPVLFICENNRYMEYTPIASVTSVPNPAADRAAANGMPGVLVDGNDVVAVHDTVAEAVERARGGGGPTVVEALTYRHFGHSRTDPATYRPAEEVEEWLARDPLLLTRRRLVERGLPEGDVDAADARAARVVAAAAGAAREAPPADPADAFTDVWADGSASWRT
jgi:acetoin:2,6-dichlorophenolindophenol oxidoreductase subunit alpha